MAGEQARQPLLRKAGLPTREACRPQPNACWITDVSHLRTASDRRARRTSAARAPASDSRLQFLLLRPRQSWVVPGVPIDSISSVDSKVRPTRRHRSPIGPTSLFAECWRTRPVQTPEQVMAVPALRSLSRRTWASATPPGSRLMARKPSRRQSHERHTTGGQRP